MIKNTKRGKKLKLYSISDILVILSLLIFFVSCQREKVTGVVSETGNGEVVGILTDSSGGPVSSSVFLLFPSHNPVSLSSKETKWSSQSDEMGVYHFKNIPKGFYNVVVYFKADSTASLLQKIEVEKSMSTDTLRSQLAPTSIIEVNLEEFNLEEGGILYLPGTENLVEVSSSDLENEVIVLKNVPLGTFDVLNYLNSDSDTTPVFVAKNIKLNSYLPFKTGPYASWSYKIKMGLNTTATGADITSSVVKFPLLIKLNQTNLDFGLANADGSDLRFSIGEEEVPLKYEIEYWDESSQTATVWVLMDTIKGDDTTQYIHMYSGKVNAISKSNASDVFDTTLGYLTVWHLNENPKDPSPQFRDASPSQNSAMWQGVLSGSNSQVSPLGKGLNLGGVDNYISSSNYIMGPGSFSISLWLNTNSKAGGKLIGFDSSRTGFSDGYYDRHLWMGPDGKIHFGVYDTVALPYEKVISSVTSYNDGNWHFIHASLSQEGQLLYLDGKMVASNDSVTQVNPDYSGFWRLGYGSLTRWPEIPTNLYFEGSLDEARIEWTIRSPDWIKLTYEFGRENSTPLLLLKSVTN